VALARRHSCLNASAASPLCRSLTFIRYVIARCADKLLGAVRRAAIRS
jgi:hypothetical protein